MPTMQAFPFGHTDGKKKKQCQNKSIDHSNVFLPKVWIHHQRNDNVLLVLALFSFDCMSRESLFKIKKCLSKKAIYHIYHLDNT